MKRLNWLLGHLDRQMRSVTTPDDEEIVVDRLEASFLVPNTADRETWALAEHTGFVTGSITRGRPTRIRAEAFPPPWLGKVSLAIDPSKLAKPELVGEVITQGRGTLIRYRIDAFWSAVSAVVLTAVGVMFLFGALVAAIVWPMSMPSPAFLFAVCGATCFAFVWLIFQAAREAMRDEDQLQAWLLQQVHG